ncbi:hypothetical protein F4678DRAFT_419214 [Xylaria arbuscula]|nr:hypothetical protein F4678DRAFT_419214 [Xylaria arbuscula]
MHAKFLPIALCAIAASAATLPTVDGIAARQESSGTWYLIGFAPKTGDFGIVDTSYTVFGAPDAVPGAPALGLRCTTIGGCESTFPGSEVTANILLSGSTQLTITQTFSTGGKNVTATGVLNWNGASLISTTIPVTAPA